MPNHCENWVCITGSNETLEAVRAKPFRLMAWIPRPTEEGGDTSDWVLKHWETR